MIQITGLIEVILYVQNMEMIVRFYRDTLGLKILYPHNMTTYAQEHWVTFWSGACILALHAGGQGQKGKDSPKIVFGVKDIEFARRYLLGRDVPISDIRIAAPGVLVCDGVDPEGNAFSLEYQEIVTDIPSQQID